MPSVLAAQVRATIVKLLPLFLDSSLSFCLSTPFESLKYHSCRQTTIMPSVSRFRLGFRRSPNDDEAPSVAATELSPNEQKPTVSGTTDDVSPSSGHNEPAVEQAEKDVVPTEDAQRGVQQVEAVTLTWTKPYLISVFIL
jgi:hypothetical protein